MAVYHPVAFVTDLDALSGINSQRYQGWGIMVAKFALHIVPFLLVFALATHKKGVSCPRTGQRYPLQKTQKGGYLAAFSCVASVLVKRSRLLLLSLSFGFASALP
jgi:hypothetical protein